MTCLIAWIGVDGRGTSSCYLAADSRFSWDDKGTAVWDHGRKVFCSRQSPNIWGYYGDVVFPATVIGQIVEAVDENVLPIQEDGQALFERAFKEQLRGYPQTFARPFGVVHCQREGSSINSRFSIKHVGWSAKQGWSSTQLPLPAESGVVDSFGSGKKNFKLWSSRFSKSEVGGTSRAVFQAFCTMLEEGKDPLVGGAPQLVSLFREGQGRPHGIVWNGDAWMGGLRLGKGDFRTAIEFRDACFQRCNSNSLTLLADAQPQPLPKQF